MSRLSRLKLLTAAVNQGAYGADAILAGSPLPMLTSNLEITPIQGDTIDRPLDDGVLGNKPQTMVGTHVRVTGYVEMAGSGTQTGIPAYSPILEAAGFGATVGADHVLFERVTPGTEKDATFYVYKDGIVHILLGARATFTTVMTVNEIPRREFELVGLYGGHSANVSIPAADFSSFQKPNKVGATHTEFRLAGTEFRMFEFSMNVNNQIEYDENTVDEQIYLTDYNTEGNFTIEAPAHATFDPIALALNETLVPLSITQGTQEGFIEKIDAAEVQIGRPEYGDRQGRIIWNIPFRVINAFTIRTE